MNRCRRLAIASTVCLGLALPSAQAGSIDPAGLAMHGQTTERQAALLALYWLLANRAPRPAAGRPDAGTRAVPGPRTVAGGVAAEKGPAGPAARADARQVVASSTPGTRWRAF